MTTATTKARFAVSAKVKGNLAGARSQQTMAAGRMEARRHAIVLARPFGKALVLAALGAVLLLRGIPLSPLGAASLAVAALIALRAVWRWERTRIVLADGQLLVVHGTLRRRTASARAGAVEVEQTLLGRLLGYGTVIAGELEVPYVARPRELAGGLDR
jgi:uncharacterized membrane protein YdbT with pleckstrin-like domain